MRTLYRGLAVADGTGPRLRTDMSLLVEDRRIVRLAPVAEVAGAVDLEVDASGATLVPGLVDCHNHVTMPGGAQWIDRGADPTEVLRANAEEAGELAVRSGVRWLRDAGSPRRDGRALAISVREDWAGRADRPGLLSAGTWLDAGRLPEALAVRAVGGEALRAAALRQLDEGADLVKIYLDGPDPAVCPYTVEEVAGVVRAVRGRGAKVAAHAGTRDAVRVGAHAGVDSLEHCWDVDAELADVMAAGSVTLVSTLAVLHSVLGFATTTSFDRFRTPVFTERLVGAEAAIRSARAAGVVIATGSDSGGGSLRHGELAWEVVALVRAGLAPWEALAAATWRGGDLIARAGAGRLVEGGPSDAFLVHGDPYTEPEALWRIWRTL